MHKDNYENIYVQVTGRKHFVLLPPVCHPCVNEQELRPATYSRASGALELALDDEGENGPGGVAGGQGEAVPFATWDPDEPDVNATGYSTLARPMRVTLLPGDMLYLPAMW
jgi:peptidyl-lysine (3S)-dioxygenase / protease